jgi:hypothetical protein
MVVSQIIGGLGNQMFQYATGRALALKRGTEFYLDISCFDRYKLHQGFELMRIFECSGKIVSERQTRHILDWQRTPLFLRTLTRPQLAMFRRKGLVVEPHFHYWSELDNVETECFLVGYWQSEKYFSDASSNIRMDFRFKEPMNKSNEEMAKKISTNNAVSLHVRRGDYANNAVIKATHGLCSQEYYQNAIEYMARKIIQPYFYVFSDDIDWVKNNLTLNFPHQYVDQNYGVESYNDMRLMSLCQHHIIANSSFSWWGAWLNPNPGKIVITPQNWFANGNRVVDLHPHSWVQM